MGGALNRNRAMEAGMDYESWRSAYKAARATQKSTTGVYNPGTGEREYTARHKGVEKDMQGRKYRGQ
jgi:hypothetical protein